MSSLVTCQNKAKCLGEGIKKAIKQKAQLKKALWLEGLLMRHMFLPVSVSFERLEHPCLLFSDRLSTDGNSAVLSVLVGPENVTCICFKQQTNMFAQDSSRHCWVILGFTWEPLFLPLKFFQHGRAGVCMWLFWDERWLSGTLLKLLFWQIFVENVKMSMLCFRERLVECYATKILFLIC